jgi:hypothetical protein
MFYIKARDQNAISIDGKGASGAYVNIANCRPCRGGDKGGVATAVLGDGFMDILLFRKVKGRLRV